VSYCGPAVAGEPGYAFTLGLFGPFVLGQAFAFLNSGYRAEFGRWITFKDPFGWGLWTRHWRIQLALLALLVLPALVIGFVLPRFC
jgi:hypothetical protein